MHASESAVKNNPWYAPAKTGDVRAARRLVEATIDLAVIRSIRDALGDGRPTLVAVHAVEAEGINRIPAVLAEVLAEALALPIETSLVQANAVGHTGADGWWRLAHPAKFDGTVLPGAAYVLVDDFVGQGGTLANLRGFILGNEAHVRLATTLTGQSRSARLALSSHSLDDLRSKHGHALEEWWIETFGYGFECLTESEARYLARVENAERVRDRLAAAGQARDD